MIRTFVAVELDPPLKQAIATLQDGLRRELQRLAPGVRLQWTRPDSIHLTLKFLGDIQESQVGDIHAALKQAGRDHARFSVEVKGLDVFPNLRGPRVLWIGLAGSTDRLIRLTGSIDGVLTSLGFPVERRPYTPHLTLARVKAQFQAIGHALADSGVMRQSADVGCLPIHAVALMKSQPTPSGSIYSRLGLITLADDKV